MSRIPRKLKKRRQKESARRAAVQELADAIWNYGQDQLQRQRDAMQWLADLLTEKRR